MEGRGPTTGDGGLSTEGRQERRRPSKEGHIARTANCRKSGDLVENPR
jgi:hypothetical protein